MMTAFILFLASIGIALLTCAAFDIRHHRRAKRSLLANQVLSGPHKRR